MSTVFSISIPGNNSWFTVDRLGHAAVATTAAFVPASRPVCAAYAVACVGSAIVDRYVKWASIRLLGIGSVAYTLSKVQPHACALSSITGWGAYLVDLAIGTRMFTLKFGLGVAVVSQCVLFVCGVYFDRYFTMPLAQLIQAPEVRLVIEGMQQLIMNHTSNNTGNSLTLDQINEVAPLRCRGMGNTDDAGPDAPEYTNPDDCAICTDPFARDTLYRSLPCGHPFHATCIDNWLMLHSTCPICKASLPTAPSGDASSDDESTGEL